MKEEMRKVYLPRGRKNEENFVIVSVNGRSYKIMKGVEVEVPAYVAEVLENSRMMADTAGGMWTPWPTEKEDTMGKMTAGQVLTQVDSLLPNAYTREEKLRWLLQAEGTLIREVLRPVDRETSVPEKLEESTVLVAGTPYDGLYDLYVQAQIHYADGDMAHWNNAMALWNRGVEALQAETLRKMGKMQTANCLRLC